MKSIRTILFIYSLLLLFCSSTSAQISDMNKNYFNNTIYFQGNKYVKGGVTHRVGFFHSNLKKEMTVSPNATIEFRKFEKKRNAGMVVYLLGLTTMAVGTRLAVKSGNSGGSSKKGAGILLGGAALSLFSIPLFSRANNHLHKAVWIRNADVIKF